MLVLGYNLLGHVYCLFIYECCSMYNTSYRMHVHVHVHIVYEYNIQVQVSLYILCVQLVTHYIDAVWISAGVCVFSYRN